MTRKALPRRLVIEPPELLSFRMQLGWSQKQMAHELGLRGPAAHRTVQNWELGENRPPPYLRLALMSLLMGGRIDR